MYRHCFRVCSTVHRVCYIYCEQTYIELTIATLTLGGLEIVIIRPLVELSNAFCDLTVISIAFVDIITTGTSIIIIVAQWSLVLT